MAPLSSTSFIIMGGASNGLKLQDGIIINLSDTSSSKIKSTSHLKNIGMSFTCPRNQYYQYGKEKTSITAFVVDEMQDLRMVEINKDALQVTKKFNYGYQGLPIQSPFQVWTLVKYLPCWM